jgi:hypothetical protein
VVVLFLSAFFAFTGLRTQIGLVSGLVLMAVVTTFATSPCWRGCSEGELARGHAG